MKQLTQQSTRRQWQVPDFAGTALVDILANGLAMLIIVIVLSISAHGEREQRTASQVEEVETMMSRRFSTSLVLNRLAASKPAQLHDYRNSPLDQQYSPHILPIIELHHGFVREFYSGQIWSREVLLQEPNVMDAWLADFDDERKVRLRIDVYDINQFYLVMSILRDHKIAPRHWHFLSGGLGLAQAGACPPGVAAQDCAGGRGLGNNPGSAGKIPELPTLTEGTGSNEEESIWPPSDLLGTGNSSETALNQFPGGATLDSFSAMTGSGSFAYPGKIDPLASSFPNAQPGLGTSRQGSSDGQQGQQDQQGQQNNGFRFRLSAPESLRNNQDNGQTLGWGSINPSTEEVLTVLFDFINTLQTMLDAGISPSNHLIHFQQLLKDAFHSSPVLDEQTRTLVSTLIWEVFLNLAQDSDESDRQLNIIPLKIEEHTSTALLVTPNQRLQQATVRQAQDATPLPETARPVLRLNTHPDVWRGLSLPLEWNSILLMSPKQQHTNQLRWRAVAYITPKFDDFIIGFTYASVDDDGRLVVPTEDNRVSLSGRPLLTTHHTTLFGARGWLVTLYVVLVVCLLGFLLVRRLNITPSGEMK